MRHHYNFTLVLILMLFWKYSSAEAKDLNFLCPKLQHIVDSFIGDETGNVYYMVSRQQDSRLILTLGRSSSYHEGFVDHYHYYHNNLLTYYSMDNQVDNNIVNTMKMNAYKNRIKGFQGESILSNCVPKMETFVFFTKDSVQKSSNVTMKLNDATDTTVFKSLTFNKLLNNYINKTTGYLYEVYFFNLDGVCYTAFYSSFFYNNHNADAYFLRNKHLVVLYGLNNLHSYDVNFVSMQDVNTFSGDIPKARGGVKYLWFDPFCEVYQIHDKNDIILQEDYRAAELVSRMMLKYQENGSF